MITTAPLDGFVQAFADRDDAELRTLSAAGPDLSRANPASFSELAAQARSTPSVRAWFDPHDVGSRPHLKGACGYADRRVDALGGAIGIDAQTCEQHLLGLARLGMVVLGGPPSRREMQRLG